MCIRFVSRPDVKMSKGILRTLQKIRSKTIPKAPKNAQEITDAFNIEAVYEKFGKTIRTNENERSEFFKGAIEHENYSFCVFASNDIVNAIQKEVPESTRKLFADGTFGVSKIHLSTHLNFLSRIDDQKYFD